MFSIVSLASKCTLIENAGWIGTHSLDLHVAICICLQYTLVVLDTLLQPLTFDWDSGNLEKNWSKHQVTSKEAEEVFFQKPIFFYRDQRHSQLEIRLVALGKTKDNRYLFIVFTIRKQRIRVISARPQNRDERSFYEAQSSSSIQK